MIELMFTVALAVIAFIAGYFRGYREGKVTGRLELMDKRPYSCPHDEIDRRESRCGWCGIYIPLVPTERNQP